MITNPAYPSKASDINAFLKTTLSGFPKVPLETSGKHTESTENLLYF